MRRILLIAAAALVWVGVAAAPASAHTVSGVSATNFHTRLKSVTPDVPGLHVKVVEAGSRLEVENRTGKELLVLGYKDEPYLRIGPDGVFQNRLSPATYINQTRKGKEPPPAAQNAKVGDTDWQKISSEPIARWHDHRIHWMLATNPPQVQANPDRRQEIIPEWTVTMKLGGTEPVAVKGDLVWEPGPSGLPWFGLIVVLFAVVVAIGWGAGWAPGLAAVTALLLVIDVFHAVGLGLANAGGLGYRLSKTITQGPYAVAGWVIGILSILWLLRRRSDGLSLAALTGLLIALLGGLSDVTALYRSEVPFAFGAALARLAVSTSIGLGFGLAVAAGLRVAGVGGRVMSRVPAHDDALPSPAS
jgi:hypothetical protein